MSIIVRSFAVFMVLSVVLAGCGSGEAQGTGKVVYKGTPVTEGNVNFLAKDKGIGAITQLDPTGGFKLPAGLTPGQYAISVTPPIPAPPPPGTRPTTAPSPIPLKARDPVSSGVTVSLQSGSNEVLVELKD